MSLDTLIPRDLPTLLYVAVATILGWIGGWIRGRKRERAEIIHLGAQARKTEAEARQIDANTNISLTEAAGKALERAERLQTERDHWQLKAFDLQLEVKECHARNAALMTQHKMDNSQLEQQMAFIKAKKLKREYVEFTDKPKDQ